MIVNFHKTILSLGLIAVYTITTAQTFIKNNTSRALTFKEMQLQFHQYKKSHNLNAQKYWKNFKRYEADIQLHTNTQGEPAGFEEYINEAIRVAEEKEKSSSPTPWFPSGPNAVPVNLTGYMENGIGRVNCVAFHPTDQKTFFVGVAQGGVWKTTNGGSSYTPLTDYLPINRISDICIDPNNPNTMYVSVCDYAYIGVGLFLNGRKRHTHYGLGVYKSTDGGKFWSATGLSFQLTDGDASLIKKILINPGNSSELIACGASGMYKSTNGGTTWTKKLDSLFWDMVQDPVNPNIIYAATGWVKNSNIGHAAIYKSTNFGNTWSLLNTNIPMQGTVERVKLAVSPSDANYVYAICSDNTQGFYGIYKSTNAGNSWTYLPPQLNILEWGQGNGTGGQGNYDLALIVDKTDKNKIYSGGINIWGSTDGGVSFNPVSHWTYSHGNNTVHGDIHAIERNPINDEIFVCSDGGLYKTAQLQIGSWTNTNWPTTWTNLSDGMQCTSFYRLSSSKNFQGRLIAGAQDNASFYYNGSTWSTIFGGDGMDNYLDPNNNLNILGSSQYGTFYYSNDGFSGTVVGSNPNNEAAEWVTPVVADYNHPGVVYVGNENVVKSTDGGQSWSALAGIYTNSLTQQSTEISALAVSNTHSQVIYAARRVRYELGLKGIVFRTANGGASFVNITNNLPDSLYYTVIEVSPTNSDVAVICMAGFSAGNKVYRTTNGGASWTNISYNLPNVPVNCIKYIPNTDHIVIATDFGIYLLYDNSSVWAGFNLGLPNVIVSDIEFNPAKYKVYISTFGRGIWETFISSLLPTGFKEEGLNVPSFLVYPTINKGRFTIQADLEGKTTQLTILDVQGKNVYHSKLTANNTELVLSALPGVYYVRLEQEGKIGVRKIIVE